LNQTQSNLLGTGAPEVKFIPACLPKTQLFHSPWEKQKRGKNKKTTIITLDFIVKQAIRLSKVINKI
jgi:hypothetical protein